MFLPKLEPWDDLCSCFYQSFWAQKPLSREYRVVRQPCPQMEMQGLWKRGGGSLYITQVHNGKSAFAIVSKLKSFAFSCFLYLCFAPTYIFLEDKNCTWTQHCVPSRQESDRSFWVIKLLAIFDLLFCNCANDIHYHTRSLFFKIILAAKCQH